MILRLRCDSDTSQIAAFGDKFGCLPGWQSEFLLKMASELHLNVCGVSFHVGRAISNHEVYDEAITVAADTIKYGRTLGHQMSLLDIGGGYLGSDKEAFVSLKFEGLFFSLIEKNMLHRQTSQKSSKKVYGVTFQIKVSMSLQNQAHISVKVQ